MNSEPKLTFFSFFLGRKIKMELSWPLVVTWGYRTHWADFGVLLNGNVSAW